MPGQFGRPNLPDPLPAVQWSHKIIPSPGELETITRNLEIDLEIEIVTCSFYHNSFVIELDAEFYASERLPGRLAGRRAYWGVVGEVWGLKPSATARQITSDPNHDIRDDQDLDVYHDNNVIGTVKTRFEHQDWALVERTNDVQFTNTEYFGAPVPHHLLDCWDIADRVAPISYFAADGFTTGTVWFNYAGLVYRKQKGYIVEMNTDFAYIFRRLRGTADELACIPAPGLCGAPVIHQKTTDDLFSNSVCGFVWLANLQVSWVVPVGPLIDAGWETVQQ